MMVKFKEKRSSERLTLSSPIRYRRKGSQLFGNTIARDISNRGIGFVSNEFFPISTQLIFEIQHPKTHEFIKAVGEVAWVSNQAYSERFSIGARFIGPPMPI